MIELVQSVDRTLSIMELLSDHDEGLGITEIGERLGLHKSTVHRLLSTLIYKEYVVKDKESNKYMLTLKLFELGNKKVEKLNILSASRVYTKSLMESINEVVHLVVPDENNIVYIDKVEADNTIRMASNIGRHSPMYSTSVGKAIMAFLSEEEVDAIWEKSNIVKYTDRTITDLTRLKQELERVRQKGYAEDDEENELGVRCIGAPVFNYSGKVEGAISISGPTIRVTKDKVEEYGREVKKFADLISRELGYKSFD